MSTTETKEITNSEDLIDVRDVIARVEQLEDVKIEGDLDDEQVDEWGSLSGLLEQLAGNGGDEEWRGSWYPLVLVRDSYWRDFAESEAEDLGLVDDSLRWPHNCIDWDRAARELQSDYSSVELDGVTYWYR
jgi:hypothetical protein